VLARLYNKLRVDIKKLRYFFIRAGGVVFSAVAEPPENNMVIITYPDKLYQQKQGNDKAAVLKDIIHLDYYMVAKNPAVKILEPE